MRAVLGRLRPTLLRSARGATLSTKTGGPPHPFESFLSGSSANYVEDMYHAWRQAPESVHASWAAVFARVDAGQLPGQTFVPPPTINAGATLSTAVAPPSSALVSQGSADYLKVMQMVHAFQARGHNICDLDPLGMYDADLDGSLPPDLDLANYGWTEADLDKEFSLGGVMLSGFLDGSRGPIKLRDIISRLQETYTAKVGFEYMHIWDHEQVNWLRNEIETRDAFVFSKEEKMRLLENLTRSDHFETFLASKFSTAKRFGLEGGEALLPGMQELLDESCELGVDNVVIGMAHRGRLNVLANFVNKPMEQIFSEFQGGSISASEDDWSGSGDVKYHLGMSHTKRTSRGHEVHISLVANPSHLECVNPVVEGKARAKQHYAGDTSRTKTMPILIHGDAAFAGQGVVFETMGLSDLHDYTTGGTVHLVINNQIGFTTDPRSSRSTPYCTDVAKAAQAPIFHVNGDDVESVAYVCRLAAKWRQRFKRDVVIDIVCYRRHGHNELDQPMFTQPEMYTAIKAKQPTMGVYKDQLVAEGTVTAAAAQELSDSVLAELGQQLEASRSYVPKKSDWLAHNWKGMLPMNVAATDHQTGLEEEAIKTLGKALGTLPADFKPHRTIGKIYDQRLEMITSGKGLDWAIAEQLAWASLLVEGNHVRISGQDVERGTFSHRHAVVHDQVKWGEKYCALKNLSPSQAAFSAVNSSLSEFAVLGFELGYCMENPASLVLWEAQFGDFANTAQCMIDQFICSGEQKWLRQSGLVMLLPHGFEGQGPEHSSARLERFLQLCDDDEDVFATKIGKQQQVQASNWVVVNVTTPANYFHVLRRQVVREFRKPLIVMSPKSLLRHRLVKSDMEEFLTGTRFHRFIADTGEGLVGDDKVRKVVMCSGKVYYDLLAERTKSSIDDVAISRLEQISPFPYDHVQAQAKKYPNAEIVWCQEEPKNAGAWSYVKPRLVTATRDVRPLSPTYAGRGPSAATSTGHGSVHAAQQAELLAKAVG